MEEKSPPWAFVYCMLVILMAVAAIVQIRLVPAGLIPGLFGDKTSSMFDLWFIGHFMFGVILAGGWQRITCESISDRWWTQKWFLLVTISIVAWELSELLMELGYFGASVVYWKAGVEHWSNRFIADVLMGIVGTWAYRKMPTIFWPVVLLGIIWETIHVLSPTAMSVQERLLQLVNGG